MAYQLVPKVEAKIYHIIIKNNAFHPDYLKVEKGSIVEWKVCTDSIEENETSLYHMGKRSHVIAFKNLPNESPMLKDNDKFKVRFLESGHFQYYC